MFIPADTQVTVNGTPETLVEAYRSGGTSGLQTAVEALIGAGVDEVSVDNSRNWQDLVSPVGTLTFDNPDDVIVNGSKLFAQGPVSVTPDKVGSFLFSRNWAEDDTNRLLRQEQFWRAWMARIAASRSPGAVPGELDTGIGRFVRTLAHEDVEYAVLPRRGARAHDRLCRRLPAGSRRHDPHPPGDPVPVGVASRVAPAHPGARRHRPARPRSRRGAQPGRARCPDRGRSATPRASGRRRPPSIVSSDAKRAAAAEAARCVRHRDRPREPERRRLGRCHRGARRRRRWARRRRSTRR